MFGDPLSTSECAVLVDQVGKCKLPFQCAQYVFANYWFLSFNLFCSGRPSMHPLVDLSSVPAAPAAKQRKGLSNYVVD